MDIIFNDELDKTIPNENLESPEMDIIFNDELDKNIPNENLESPEMEIIFNDELDKNITNENSEARKIVVLQDIVLNPDLVNNEKCKKSSDLNKTEIDKENRIEEIENELNNTEGTEGKGSLKSSCTKSNEKSKNTDTQAKVGNVFEKHLSFPKPFEKSTNKRRREKLPSAISSEAWRKHYQEKDKEKEEKKNTKKRNKSSKNTTLMANITDNNKNKQQCGVCDEDLESDTEIENEKNVGCDVCPRWFHLGCTKFHGSTYNEVANADYVCDFCEKY